jgi:hypothetical protein
MRGEIMSQPTCKEQVAEHYKSRMSALRQLIEAYRNGDESVPGVGNLYDYGLYLDYVPAGTFADQRRGYFRYQISTGGPGDEFRFYTDDNLQPTRIEYWFLDWFDGAKRIVGRDTRDWGVLVDLFEAHSPEYAMEQAG